MKRRSALLGLFGCAALPRIALAAPDPAARRLENRLELWHNYAKKTTNLVARLTTTRTTSLLHDPLVVTGSLLFLAPATLVLRDDGLAGSTTIIDPEGTRIFTNASTEAAPPTTPPGREPALDWVAERLVRTFAPGQPDTLVADDRTHVPKGRGYRLELLPPKGSTIRRLVRSFAIELDAVVGAVVQITIAEAQGDRVVLGLQDHRQNLEPEDLEPHLRPVASYLPSLRE
jgi:hypothetical protein